MVSSVASLALLVVAATGVAPRPQHEKHGAGPSDQDTKRQSVELVDQIETVRAATERYRDHRVAVADGYELFGGDGPLMGEHWSRRDKVGEPFDVGRPSTLQYFRVAGERVLAGVAYTVYRKPDEPLPEGFAGDADVWHVHDVEKIALTATQDRPLLRWLTQRRVESGKVRWADGRTELTMVHAWIWVDNPDGMFAQDHRLIPYLRLGLPVAYGSDASLEAAYGVSLLADDACADEVRRVNWLAAASWRQRRALRSGCGYAERTLRAALERALDEDTPDRAAAVLNAAAETSWRSYRAARDEILTDDQRQRLTVVIEHPDGPRGHGH